MPCFVHFPRFRHCKNYWNGLRFDKVAVKCTLLRFMNHGENVGFVLIFPGKVRTQLGWCDKFYYSRCRISSRLKRYKNYKKNRLRFAKVILKNKMSRFYGSLCIRRIRLRHLRPFSSATQNIRNVTRHCQQVSSTKKSIFFNHDFLHRGTCYDDFNHDFKDDFNHVFLHSGTPLLGLSCFWAMIDNLFP